MEGDTDASHDDIARLGEKAGCLAVVRQMHVRRRMRWEVCRIAFNFVGVICSICCWVEVAEDVMVMVDCLF
jgi:hypothetical protein